VTRVSARSRVVKARGKALGAIIAINERRVDLPPSVESTLKKRGGERSATWKKERTSKEPVPSG
jgi:hypothetical protein